MTKMLIDRSVVEQVLKTLEEAEQCPVWPNTLKKAAKVPESATALRTALAQSIGIEAEADRRGRVLAAEMRAALSHPQIHRPLPPDTVIEYCGQQAKVVEDQGGLVLTVDVRGRCEKWVWVLGGYTCTVVSLPETKV